MPRRIPLRRSAGGLELGADGVECDLHMSRDGHLVVFHDETLNRTTDGKGPVGEKTLAELKTLDAGSWYGPQFAGERIPTLGELLALVEAAEIAYGRPLHLVLELKHGNDVYAGVEEALVLAIAGSPLFDRILVIGFDHRAMSRIKAMAPTLRTGVLYDARPVDAVMLAQAAGADLIGPSVKWVDGEEASAAEAAGLGVFVWTANTEEAMNRVIALGVTAAGSDYPDRLLALRSNSRSAASKAF